MERLLEAAGDGDDGVGGEHGLWDYPYWGSQQSHSARSWPWGIDALLTQLGRHTGHPKFKQVLDSFVRDTYSHSYFLKPGAVSRALELMRNHSGSLRELMEAIRSAEEERWALVARYDLGRVEQELRRELSNQVWNLRRQRVLGLDDGTYERLLRALSPSGDGRPLAQLEAEAARKGYRHHWGFGAENIFTGRALNVRQSEQVEGYLVELRSLADDPSERFLSYFDPEVLRERFWKLESAYAPASSWQWLMVVTRWGTTWSAPPPCSPRCAASRPAAPPPLRTSGGGRRGGKRSHHLTPPWYAPYVSGYGACPAAPR